MLARAARLGLTRFDALLIIAAVQHGQTATTATHGKSPRASDRWLIIAAVLSVQTAILGGVAWLVMS